MREVNLPWVFGVSDVHKATQDAVIAAARTCDDAQRNGQKVMAAALAVEKELEKVINARVAGSPDLTNTFFASAILAAEWFTFSAKRKLTLVIFAEFDHLVGQDKADLERLLRKVMSLRNRFAHGHFIVKDDGAYISYFEGTAREDLLSDEFWSDVESTFNRTIAVLRKGQISMSISVPAGFFEGTL